MAFTLVYKKQFVKIGENFLILGEAGDSNMYDSDRKRSRSWQNLTFAVNHHGLLMSLDEVNRAADFTLDDVSKHYPGEDIKPGFGGYIGLSLNGKSTFKTTFSDYKNFFKGGLAKALTIEEIIQQRGSLEIQQRSKVDHSLITTHYPKTTGELKFLLFGMALKDVVCQVSYNPPPRKQTLYLFKEPKRHTDGFVLAHHHHFLGRVNKRRLSYGGISAAQTYPNRKKAQTALDKALGRFKNLFPVEIVPYPKQQQAA